MSLNENLGEGISAPHTPSPSEVVGALLVIAAVYGTLMFLGALIFSGPARQQLYLILAISATTAELARRKRYVVLTSELIFAASIAALYFGRGFPWLDWRGFWIFGFLFFVGLIWGKRIETWIDSDPNQTYNQLE